MPGFVTDYYFGALSQDQAITASTVSTNSWFRGLNTSDHATTGLSVVSPLYVELFVSEAFTAAGAATLQINLISDTNTNLITAPVTHASTAAIAKTALTAGAYFYLLMPWQESYKPHIGLSYTVSTGPMTAGKLTARITPVVMTGKSVFSFNDRINL